MLTDKDKTKLIAAYKGGRVMLYVTYVPKAEALMKTWHFCMSFGGRFWWMRIFGLEFGVRLSDG